LSAPIELGYAHCRSRPGYQNGVVTSLRDPHAAVAPLVWRFGPAVPTVALLMASACAAGDLYGHPGIQPRIAMIVVGVAAVCVAVAALRMALVVDDDGIAVRFLGRVSWIPWAEVQAIGLADVRGSETIRIIRVDETQVDVPPSLLQPVWPTSKPRATARLRGVLSQITEVRKPWL